MTDDVERSKRWLIVTFAVAAAVLQALAIIVYLSIESGRDRGAPRGAFTYEAVTGKGEIAALLEARNGTTRDLAQLRGKTVLVHFWATWCAPCKQELPGLFEVGRELARSGRFELVAVTVDRDWASVDAFFPDAVPPAVYRDASGAAVESFAVSALPDSYLLDPTGKPVLRFAGARNWKSPEAERLLRSRVTASME